MKYSLLFYFLFLVIFNLNAQTTDLPKYNFGIANEFRLDSSALILSPAIQYYPNGNYAIFLGIPIPFYRDTFSRYNTFGYRLGIIYMFPKHRNKIIEEYFELEFSHISYDYKTVSYDSAVPTIPIKATIIHEHQYSDVSLLYGARLRFVKRYYIGGMIGFKLTWLTLIDPDTYKYFSYNLYNYESDSPNSMRMGFTGMAELGVYF